MVDKGPTLKQIKVSGTFCTPELGSASPHPSLHGTIRSARQHGRFRRCVTPISTRIVSKMAQDKLLYFLSVCRWPRQPTQRRMRNRHFVSGDSRVIVRTRRHFAGGASGTTLVSKNQQELPEQTYIQPTRSPRFYSLPPADGPANQRQGRTSQRSEPLLTF
jgi:hypothetical protein